MLDILPACLSVHCMNAWCLQRPEEGIRSPRTEVTDSCGFWELNLAFPRPLYNQTITGCDHLVCQESWLSIAFFDTVRRGRWNFLLIAW